MSGGIVFLFLNNLCYGTVLYCSVLCSFCWILFWTCNLFNLYLLVLFHLLKVFVSWHGGCICLFFLPLFGTISLFVCFTGTHTLDTAFELSQCQINVAAQKHTHSGGNSVHNKMQSQIQVIFVPQPPNTVWVAAHHPGCQNLWEVLFTSLCSRAPNNNCGMRRCNPRRDKSSARMPNNALTCM